MTYAGADPETAKFFETVIGKTRITQLPNDAKYFSENYREQNLMNANEVRTLASDQMLIISTNRKPVLINTQPYLKNGKFKRWIYCWI